MTCLIDVGGGMRDVFGCGAADCFLDNNITFDLCIGVSAGSANLASFLALQRERNLRFYADYASRKEYMSFKNFIKNGSFFDLDYIYSTLSDEGGEDPIDFEAFSKNPTDLLIVTTNAATGKTEYLPKSEIKKNNLWAIKASCAVPAACRPYKHGETEYFDGGISNPIPIQKAVDMGCDKIVVIIPRPLKEKTSENSKIMKPFMKQYPEIVRLVKQRPEIYNEQLRLLKKYKNEGKAIIVSPSDDKGINMITTDRAKLLSFYKNGYENAEKIISNCF